MCDVERLTVSASVYRGLENSGVATPTAGPQPCWVMGFAQFRRVFWGGGEGRGVGGRTRQQTCAEKHLTAANCLYISDKVAIFYIILKCTGSQWSRCNDDLSLYHSCDSTTIRLRYDYDEKLTCLFLLASNRVEWKQAHAISRSRIVVVS